MPVKQYRNVKELKEDWNNINERIKHLAGHKRLDELHLQLRLDIAEVAAKSNKSMSLI